MIVVTKGIALPDYMGFILELCSPTRHTKKAVEAGGLLNVDYHPPYVEVACGEPEEVVEEARRRGLRVYRGKRHITISDGVYKVRIWLEG